MGWRVERGVGRRNLAVFAQGHQKSLVVGHHMEGNNLDRLVDRPTLVAVGQTVTLPNVVVVGTCFAVVVAAVASDKLVVECCQGWTIDRPDHCVVCLLVWLVCSSRQDFVLHLFEVLADVEPVQVLVCDRR